MPLFDSERRTSVRRAQRIAVSQAAGQDPGTLIALATHSSLALLLVSTEHSAMLTPSVLLDALMQSCRPDLPAGTSLLKSGDPTEASLSSVWLEFWVDRISSPVARRNSSHSRVDLSFTVNCFGRPPAAPDQVQALAETTRHHLTHLRLPLTSETLTVGWVTLLEAEMRDLSRPATQKSAGLSQWSVTVRGTLHDYAPDK